MIVLYLYVVDVYSFDNCDFQNALSNRINIDCICQKAFYLSRNNGIAWQSMKLLSPHCLPALALSHLLISRKMLCLSALRVGYLLK